MHADTYRPTWDATYQGLPLSSSAYKAHLHLLKAYRAGKLPEDPKDLPEIAVHQAKVALGQAGIIDCATCANLRATYGRVPASTPFHWCEYRLTQYGEIYAGQRGI